MHYRTLQSPSISDESSQFTVMSQATRYRADRRVVKTSHFFESLVVQASKISIVSSLIPISSRVESFFVCMFVTLVSREGGMC
jgi:hypothetical protein